jgi:hypothetical protein
VRATQTESATGGTHHHQSALARSRDHSNQAAMIGKVTLLLLAAAVGAVVGTQQHIRGTPNGCTSDVECQSEGGACATTHLRVGRVCDPVHAQTRARTATYVLACVDVVFVAHALVLQRVLFAPPAARACVRLPPRVVGCVLV